MYLIFQKVNWKRKDESTGVPSLSKSIIKSVKELFPKGREQNEIAELFEILDTTIALHQRNQKGLQNRGPPIKTINLYTFLYQTR